MIRSKYAGATRYAPNSLRISASRWSGIRLKQLRREGSADTFILTCSSAPPLTITSSLLCHTPSVPHALLCQKASQPITSNLRKYDSPWVCLLLPVFLVAPTPVPLCLYVSAVALRPILLDKPIGIAIRRASVRVTVTRQSSLQGVWLTRILGIPIPSAFLPRLDLAVPCISGLSWTLVRPH